MTVPKRLLFLLTTAGRRMYKEAVMVTPRKPRLITLGWQTWSVVAVVLTLVVAVGVFILGW